MLANGFLAVYLFSFSPSAWYVGVGWVFVGLLTYYIYFSKKEAMERPSEILLEEALVSRDYSVLIPVANPNQARILGRIGAVLAKVNGGEVLALHVPRVPAHACAGSTEAIGWAPPSEKERGPFDDVIAEAKALDVPVHTVARLGRSVPRWSAQRPSKTPAT